MGLFFFSTLQQTHGHLKHCTDSYSHYRTDLMSSLLPLFNHNEIRSHAQVHVIFLLILSYLSLHSFMVLLILPLPPRGYSSEPDEADISSDVGSVESCPRCSRTSVTAAKWTILSSLSPDSLDHMLLAAAPIGERLSESSSYS